MPRIHSIAAVLSLVFVCTIGGANSSNAATIFQLPPEAYDYAPPVRRLDPKWRQSDSPFAGYLNQQFEKGLSENDRALSHASQLSGNCETVLTLELKGFLALYPDSWWHLFDPHNKRIFETEIVPNYSNAYRRCRARAELNAMVEAEKRRWNLDEDFYIDLPMPFLRRIIPDHEPSEIEQRFERAVAELLALAVCKQYAPAYADFLYVHNDLKRLVMSYGELLYIQQLAKANGLSFAELDGPVEEARRQSTLQIRESDILLAVQGGLNSAHDVVVLRFLARLCDPGAR